MYNKRLPEQLARHYGLVFVGVLALDYQDRDTVDEKNDVLSRADVTVVKGRLLGDFVDVLHRVVVIDQNQVTLAQLMGWTYSRTRAWTVLCSPGVGISLDGGPIFWNQLHATSPTLSYRILIPVLVDICVFRDDHLKSRCDV